MHDEIKILQFLSEMNNGSCTHEEFNTECDNDLTHHLATSLQGLIHSRDVEDSNGAYILTDTGKTRLAELLAMDNGFN